MKVIKRDGRAVDYDKSKIMTAIEKANQEVQIKQRAGIAALVGLGAGLGIGLATSKAVEAVARQPEADGKITKLLIIGCALAEATAIYGFVIGLLAIILLK